MCQAVIISLKMCSTNVVFVITFYIHVFAFVMIFFEVLQHSGLTLVSCLFQCVSVVAVSSDGKYLAAGSYDGWIAVFDLKTRKCLDK